MAAPLCGREGGRVPADPPRGALRRVGDARAWSLYCALPTNWLVPVCVGRKVRCAGRPRCLLRAANAVGVRCFLVSTRMFETTHQAPSAPVHLCPTSPNRRCPRRLPASPARTDRHPKPAATTSLNIRSMPPSSRQQGTLASPPRARPATVSRPVSTIAAIRVRGVSKSPRARHTTSERGRPAGCRARGEGLCGTRRPSVSSAQFAIHEGSPTGGAMQTGTHALGGSGACSSGWAMLGRRVLLLHTGGR